MNCEIQTGSACRNTDNSLPCSYSSFRVGRQRWEDGNWPKIFKKLFPPFPLSSMPQWTRGQISSFQHSKMGQRKRQACLLSFELHMLVPGAWLAGVEIITSKGVTSDRCLKQKDSKNLWLSHPYALGNRRLKIIWLQVTAETDLNTYHKELSK